MSSDDKNYSNIYTFKTPTLKTEGQAQSAGTSGKVLKAGDAKAAIIIEKYVPNKLAQPPVRLEDSNLALQGLKQNFETLQDLQARLRFILCELEDLVK